MKFKTVRDIIEHVGRFHEEVRQFYEQAADSSEGPRTKLLMDYLSRYNDKYKKQIKEIEKSGRNKVLDQWIQFPPDALGTKSLDSFTIRSGMNIEDVFKTILEFQNALIAYFEQLAKTTKYEEAVELFENMAEATKREKGELAFSLNTLQDI